MSESIEQLRESLNLILPDFRATITSLNEENQPMVGKIDLEKLHVDERAAMLRIYSGDFKFLGAIDAGLDRFFPDSIYLPNLRNIVIPRWVQKKGWGRKMVNTWETSLSQFGYDTFLITNVSKDAIGFWEKMGYNRPLKYDVKQDPPYFMYKTINDEVNDPLPVSGSIK